jgi:hypothetical protein
LPAASIRVSSPAAFIRCFDKARPSRKSGEKARRVQGLSGSVISASALDILGDPPGIDGKRFDSGSCRRLRAMICRWQRPDELAGAGLGKHLRALERSVSPRR